VDDVWIARATKLASMRFLGKSVSALDRLQIGTGLIA
jgi:hypothetical protein